MHVLLNHFKWHYLHQGITNYIMFTNIYVHYVYLYLMPNIMVKVAKHCLKPS